MFKKLSEKSELRNSLQSMARFLDTRFIISVDNSDYLITIEKGIVKKVEEGPFVMPSYTFKLKASHEEWSNFLQFLPKPGSHDLIALLRGKKLQIEGDLHPFMSHLLYFKLLLASLRPQEPKL